MPDAHANFATSLVATAPSPAASGLSLVVTTGEGSRFPATPFNAVVCPANELATPANAEIVRVTGRSTDTLTITRTQEGTSARTIGVGDRVYAGITAKTLTDVETAAPNAHKASHKVGGSDALDDYFSVPYLGGVVAPFSPILAGTTLGPTGSNTVRASRVVVPKSGTLRDLALCVGVSSGNAAAAVLNTASPRSRLWHSGSMACPATGWQVFGDPSLTVSQGDVLDFAVATDNATATFLRASVLTSSPNATQLPTNFMPGGGGAPWLCWAAPASTGPLAVPTSIAEASFSVSNCFLIIARIV